MSESVSAHTEATRIHGLPCVKCRYNLDGLMSDQKCPECGTQIHDSVEAASADSTTNRTLFCRGAVFAAAAMICGPGVTIGCIALAFLLLTAHTTTAEHAARAVAAAIVLLPTALFPYIAARGWRMVARSRAYSNRGSTGMLSRSAWAFAVLLPASLALAGAASSTTAGSSLNKALGVLACCAGASSLVIWALRTTLGFRITVESLRRESLWGLAVVGTGISILHLLSVASMHVSLAMQLSASSRQAIDVMGFSGVIGLFGLVLGLFCGGTWLLFAQSRLRRAWNTAESPETA